MDNSYIFAYMVIIFTKKFGSNLMKTVEKVPFENLGKSREFVNPNLYDPNSIQTIELCTDNL